MVQKADPELRSASFLRSFIPHIDTKYRQKSWNTQFFMPTKLAIKTGRYVQEVPILQTNAKHRMYLPYWQ